MGNSETKDNRNKYPARILAVLLLIVIPVVFAAFAGRYLCIPDSSDSTRLINFHKEPGNSIDVLMLGSSPTYSGFSSAYAYGQFGFTSYPYAVGGSSCTMWKPALQDALRTQDPKIVVVDIFGGAYDRDTVRSRVFPLYMVSNYIPLSAEKIEMAREMSERTDQGDVLSYVFPFIRYHTKIPANLLKIKDRIDIASYGPSTLKGIETITRADKLGTPDDECFTKEKLALDSDTEEVIVDFIEYCRSRDIEPLFVKYPSVMYDERDFDACKRMNSVLDLAAAHGCRTLDLQEKFYDIGLDPDSDFYNHGHTNTRGQKKVTGFLGKYIKEEMHAEPSELDASVKAGWDQAAADFETLCGITEEMMAEGKVSLLADSPGLMERVEENR